MRAASDWVFSICCGTLVCSIVSVFIPGKAYERAMGLLLGLFMLCCFAAPLHIDRRDYRIDLSTAEQSRIRAEEEAELFFLERAKLKSQNEIRRIAAAQLERYGIKPGDIKIYMDMESDVNTAIEISLPERVSDLHSVIRKTLEYAIGAAIRLEYY